MRSDDRAVALRYTADLPAPMVVASGRGSLAEAIARAARENGVTIVQDAHLADALITVDLGSLVPEELYAAVAEVLAFAMHLGKDR
jgi:type III secretion system FlhB-like substrate exporter